MKTNEQDFIEINGLLWAKENLVIPPLSYFTQYESEEIAKHVGLRLPTKKEIETLAESESTWDDELKRRWFGIDSSMKNDSKKSIFIPASGYRDLSGGSLTNVGSGGYYWSGSVYSSTSGYTLYFNSSNVGPNYNYSRQNGFAVRCVKDL